MEKSNIDVFFDIANELGIEVYLMKMKSNKFSLDYTKLDSYSINKNKYLLNSPYEI